MNPHDVPANEQLARWIAHHKHTQGMLARAVGAHQTQVSTWIHGRTLPSPEHRDAIRRITGIEFPDRRPPKPAPASPSRRQGPNAAPAATGKADAESITHLRVLPEILAELAKLARALQELPSVIADQVRVNRDIHAGLELLVTRLADASGPNPKESPPPKANGAPSLT